MSTVRKSEGSEVQGMRGAAKTGVGKTWAWAAEGGRKVVETE